MRRILLTPSQVSVLVTSLVVISCTLALFLSGYVIQQRTLRDLRSAIKPRAPRPKPPQTYLPAKFRKNTRTLEDGTIIEVEGDAEASEGQQMQREVIIEVAPTTVPEPVAQQHVAAPPRHRGVENANPSSSHHHHDQSEVPSNKLAMLDALKSQAAQKSWAVEHPDPMANSKVPVTRAERRRLIKEEIHRLSQPDEQVYYQRRLW
ncbi:uncharacterized protein F5Z01DRAFT_278135 [Emericellopsis atlantica]|uniref:Uncharacterized protein n=1 Tax=Emericellopsis atlantica TaxID=2614577 RepID=A0A9P8CLG3_9HYPO|nr:uncharacterized protein F5Z01DRAFT_278135 [Emericellopsis atlantica]KAG9251368.1 hypothetical protein F5Z01DRAFT_278135 [Emericellopsis atlantica]